MMEASSGLEADMSSENDEILDHLAGESDDPLNRRECPHCGLLFRPDEAKPSGDNLFRCPYCDWEVQAS